MQTHSIRPSEEQHAEVDREFYLVLEKVEWGMMKRFLMCIRSVLRCVICLRHRDHLLQHLTASESQRL